MHQEEEVWPGELSTRGKHQHPGSHEREDHSLLLEVL